MESMKIEMKKKTRWNEMRILDNVSMTDVESLERDQGGYKYLYSKLKYMH